MNIELVNNFYKYFKNEYIDRLDYNCWNFYKIKKHLTNNPCEAYHNHLYKIIGKKNPPFWYGINIIKNELLYFKNNYFNLLANNGPINPSNPSKINQILILINYNDTKFNNLRLEYETNIIDFNEEIIIDDENGINLNTYNIYNDFWVEHTKILSNYM